MAEEQKEIAERMVSEINAAGVWNAPVVTEITPFAEFFRAEDYHQEYFRYNSEQPYCRAVVAPKVVKFRKQFLPKLKR